ncbi:hypothetical protein WCLP8_1920001 [uncultured Gammaproteobacteria bacterium]
MTSFIARRTGGGRTIKRSELLFGIDDQGAKDRAIAEARASLDAGEGVPHDKVSEWLRDLAVGIRKPPPCA